MARAPIIEKRTCRPIHHLLNIELTPLPPIILVFPNIFDKSKSMPISPVCNTRPPIMKISFRPFGRNLTASTVIVIIDLLLPLSMQLSFIFVISYCHCSFLHSFIYSFIHSGHFCSASSSPLLVRSSPDTARILCRSFTPKRHRQLRVKDFRKVPTWRLQRDSKPRPSEGIESTNVPPRPTRQCCCHNSHIHCYSVLSSSSCGRRHC